MTANQINYWKYVEEKMQNLRAINETVRHNKIIEAQSQYSLEESKRHNLESELIGLKQAIAAQTSAAASYKQAVTRAGELVHQKWVDSQIQSRADLLANAEIAQREADVSRTRAQAGLYAAQTTTEMAKEGLITSQTALADAQAIRALVGTGTDIVNTGITSIRTLVPMMLGK